MGSPAGAAGAAGANTAGSSPNTGGAGAAGGTGVATAGSSGAAAGAAGSANTQPFEHKLLEHTWFSGPELGYDTQFLDRPFDLGAGPFRRVTLTFQLESPCFPFDKWRDNPPPDGHAFPAQCDRFDRLMYFEIDPAASPDVAPGTQVLRAITPYGGPLEKSVDITDFANTHPGPHRLRSFIGTWVDDAGQISGAKGGYFLSVQIAGEPGPPPRAALAAIPLWSGWVQPSTQLKDVQFMLPEGTQRAELSYLVTGHGGGSDASSACIGAADEFCKRTHRVYVDGAALKPEGYANAAFVPWRDDCAALCTPAQGHPMMGRYCRENPNRAESSVTAPRANWCPGDDVAPIRLQLPAASSTPGAHSARFAIDGIHADGRWQVALVVYAYGR